jgi:hypothetical protein
MQNVGSVVIGALIALVGTVLVQLWLVPLVESRKRREERWEADLLALGEALLFSEPEAASKVRSELFFRLALTADFEDAEPKWVEARRREQEDALSTAWSAHLRIRAQVLWLAERVMAIAPGSPAPAPLEKRGFESTKGRVGVCHDQVHSGQQADNPRVARRNLRGASECHQESPEGSEVACRQTTSSSADPVRTTYEVRPRQASPERRQAFASCRTHCQQPGRLGRTGLAPKQDDVNRTRISSLSLAAPVGGRRAILRPTCPVRPTTIGMRPLRPRARQRPVARPATNR